MGGVENKNQKIQFMKNKYSTITKMKNAVSVVTESEERPYKKNINDLNIAYKRLKAIALKKTGGPNGPNAAKYKELIKDLADEYAEQRDAINTSKLNEDADMDGETEDDMAALIADALAEMQDEVGRIETYQEAGIMSKNVGLVVSMTSGKKFQIQIVEA